MDGTGLVSAVTQETGIKQVGDAGSPLTRVDFTRSWRNRIMAVLALTGLFCMAPALATDEEAFWSALRSGEHFALLRHATAPGTGDPPGFMLGDCSTQRNLSAKGREQAALIGKRFRVNGIDTAQVYSSQWCRSLDTAAQLGLGPVRELPSLNSFFQRQGAREPQMRRLREWLATQNLNQPLVLVTHQVNITALTGIYPASGEVVVLHRSENGEFTIVGTLETEVE